MGSGRELGHIQADLGDDDMGGVDADPRYLIETLEADSGAAAGSVSLLWLLLGAAAAGIWAMS